VDKPQGSDRERASRHHAAAVWLEALEQQAFQDVRISGLCSVAQLRESLVACFETVDHHPDVHIA
jgi:hypothetical protein